MGFGDVSNVDTPASPQDVIQHIANMYIHGKRTFLRVVIIIKMDGQTVEVGRGENAERSNHTGHRCTNIASVQGIAMNTTCNYVFVPAK